MKVLYYRNFIHFFEHLNYMPKMTLKDDLIKFLHDLLFKIFADNRPLQILLFRLWDAYTKWPFQEASNNYYLKWLLLLAFNSIFSGHYRQPQFNALYFAQTDFQVNSFTLFMQNIFNVKFWSCIISILYLMKVCLVL